MPAEPKPNKPATTDHLICLDQFLKATALVETGGMAKQVIQSGQVKVNGQIETRRRKKLYADDVIEIEERKFKVSDAFYDDDKEESADGSAVSDDPEIAADSESAEDAGSEEPDEQA